MLTSDWEAADSKCIYDLAALISAGHISPESLRKLLLAIGTKLNEVLYDECVEIYGLHGDTEQLVNLDASEWLGNRNPAIMAFLKAITKTGRSKSGESVQ